MAKFLFLYIYIKRLIGVTQNVSMYVVNISKYKMCTKLDTDVLI